MKKIVLILALLFLPQLVSAGSQTYSTPGSYSFTVPAHTSVTLQVWGGGGGGAIYTVNAGSAGGTSQISSTAATLTANGGAGGRVGNTGGGAGGSASGGTTNSSGESGFSGSFDGRGGSSPNGGAGGDDNLDGAWPRGTGDGFPGGAPGGGGGGGCASVGRGYGEGGGGGGGGYSSRTYTAGELAAGTVVTITVGGGGAGGPRLGWPPPECNGKGGDGASGQVTITWAEPVFNCTTELGMNPDGRGYRLATIANYWLNKLGFSFCITNTSGNNYFIPSNTAAELQSFVNAISRLTGVSQSAR